MSAAVDRPNAYAMRRLVLDDHRLRKEFRDRAVTLRCPRKRHLLAVAVVTTWGTWACARDPWVGGHAPDGGWQQPAWLDDGQSLEYSAYCTCGRGWTVDLVWLAGHAPGASIAAGPGTPRTMAVPLDDDGVPNPFA